VVRWIVVLIELVLCFLLQTALFPFFEISGVVPNCLLILVISVAYTRGQIPAMITGFLAGMLLDLCFSETVGFCAVIYMVVAYFSGYTNRIYDKKDYFIPGLLGGAGELLYSMMYYAIFFMLRGKLALDTYFIYTILPRVLYTILLTFLLYPAFHGINRLLLMLEGMEND